MSQQSQPPPTPLTIGRSFIQQYYRVLTSSKPSDAKRFYLLDTSQIGHLLEPDVAVVSMSMKNTSNSNYDDDAVEITGGSVGNINDLFGWVRPLLLDNNSDSSTVITSAAINSLSFYKDDDDDETTETDHDDNENNQDGSRIKPFHHKMKKMQQ